MNISFSNRVLVVCCVPKEHITKLELCLQEANGLARAIGLNIISLDSVVLRSIHPATYIGSGTINKIHQKLQDDKIDLVYMDTALSPIQQRNLERLWACKVIDRTGLILEIFGARAWSAEGRLQVELAALSYQRSRLVKSWTHLERQRGGLGFIGGPGETQLETDKRLITKRINTIKRDLARVKQTRALHRSARRRVPYPIITLVGYTNAGKSTLFNRLTNAKVLAEDLLFATLDPTMRLIKLPSGRQVILSDTVGFIADLPTQLIAAFRATLEEVLEADLILHIRDCAHPYTLHQSQEVYKVLAELGVNCEIDDNLLEVLNKIDLTGQTDLIETHHKSNLPAVAISALTGQGLDLLLQAIDTHLNQHTSTVQMYLPVEDGAARAWLYSHAQVLTQQLKLDDTNALALDVRLSFDTLRQFYGKFPNLKP